MPTERAARMETVDEDVEKTANNHPEHECVAKVQRRCQKEFHMRFIVPYDGGRAGHGLSARSGPTSP